MKSVILAVLVIGLVGCATAPKVASVPKPPPTEKQKAAVERTKASFKSASRFIDVIPFLFLP